MRPARPASELKASSNDLAIESIELIVENISFEAA